MAYLKWISDKDLQECVQHLLATAERAMGEADFNKNVIDPFSAIFQVAGFGLNYAEWEEKEKTRQAQKTLQNHIGQFHQKILGHVKGWESIETGNILDLVNHKRKIVAEVKNKYNTVSGGNLVNVYDTIEQNIMFKHSSFKDYTGYYVAILPKYPTRFDAPFEPSNKATGSKRPVNVKIRFIDGASFYTLVTGDEHALDDLFNILPSVINDVGGRMIEASEIVQLAEFMKAAFVKKIPKPKNK